MNSAELRERLEMLPETRTVENQTREDVILTRAQFAQLVRERSEAAAALERLEALERPRSAVITCPECGHVALADIPAPAGQQGGSDGE